MGCISTLSSGTSGRSVQMVFSGSRLVLMVMPPCFVSSSARLSTVFTEFTIPSSPTTAPSIAASFCPSHSAMVGVPSVFSFISLKPVPFSCSSAAMK